MAGLRPVVDDEQLAVLRILADRRRWLGEDHARMIPQLHRLLLELIPGGAPGQPVSSSGQGITGWLRSGRGTLPARRDGESPPS
jgi:transposase